MQWLRENGEIRPEIRPEIHPRFTRDFTRDSPEIRHRHGTVFATFLENYSHWSYTDIDLVMGDLPLFLDKEELTEYDIVT